MRENGETLAADDPRVDAEFHERPDATLLCCYCQEQVFFRRGKGLPRSPCPHFAHARGAADPDCIFNETRPSGDPVESTHERRATLDLCGALQRAVFKLDREQYEVSCKRGVAVITRRNDGRRFQVIVGEASPSPDPAVFTLFLCFGRRASHSQPFIAVNPHDPDDVATNDPASVAHVDTPLYHWLNRDWMQPPHPYKLSDVLRWIVSGRIDWRMVRLVGEERGIWSKPEYFEAERLSLQKLVALLAPTLRSVTGNLSTLQAAHTQVQADLATITEDRDTTRTKLNETSREKRTVDDNLKRVTADRDRLQRELKNLADAAGTRRWKRLQTRADRSSPR